MCFALLLSDSGMLVMATDEDQSSGWQTIEDKKYYIDEVTGKAKTGWFLDDGLWYLFDSYGVMQTGWIKDVNGEWYNLSDSGAMNTGWFKDKDGKFYYLNSSGAMLKNTTVQGYKLGSDGAWIRR